MTDLRDRVVGLLSEPGTRTKESLADELDAEPTELTRTLGNLLVEGTVEEHPEIDGAYRVAEEAP